MAELRIATRRKAGPLQGVLLALALAAALVPIAVVEELARLPERLRLGEPSPITVRMPDAYAAEKTGRVVIARGEIVTPGHVPDLEKARRPISRNALGGLAVTFGLVGLLLTAYLRMSQRGRLLRTQATILGSFVAFAALAKVYLLF